MKARVNPKRAQKTKGKLTTPPKASSQKAISPPNSNKSQRIPRTMGVTGLMKEYYRTGNKSLMTKASQLTIDEWANNNYLLFGEPVNLEQMSRLTRMKPARIIGKITGPMKQWLSTNKVEDRFEAAVGFVIKGCLGTRAKTQQHLDLLTRGQRNTKTGELEYTPFVSSAVTSALQLLHTSDINLLKMVEQLKPARPTTAIQVNQSQSQAMSETGQYIGINEAVKLLDQKDPQGLLDSPEKQAKLLSQHTEEPLPEVIATRQQGLSLDGSAKPIRKRDHTQRREEDGPIYQDVIIP